MIDVVSTSWPGRALALGLAAVAACGASASAQALFEERLEQCVACHGENGASPIEHSPSLGGIDAYYALIQLVNFRERIRHSEVMNDVIADMSDNDLRAAAAWIDALPRPPAPEAGGDPERMAEGRRLVEAHRCGACHGADLLGERQTPPLRNQQEAYLLNALMDFKTERRMGERAAMVEAVTPLSEQQLAALAHYLAHLPEEG